MKKILFINNNAHGLYGQLHLMLAFKQKGYYVHALLPDDNNYFQRIEKHGIKCKPIFINGKSINPFINLKLFFLLRRHIKETRPDLICSFTIKPNLYGAIIARWLNIPIITNITGLGYAFLKKNWLNKVVISLYKFAFLKVSYVFFQNKDDKKLFEENGIFFTHETICSVLPGDGVDINKFKYIGLNPSANIKFLFSGRLLWDKGLGELVEAFEIVKKKYPRTELFIIGSYYPDNPAAISQEQMLIWQAHCGVQYLGMVDNVPEHIAKVDCLILPSYREGMPRAILEASSMGKAIITTNAAGCRDAVEDGITGFICEVKNAHSLANAMIKFIELPFEGKKKLGDNGRKKMEQEFDQIVIINKYLEAARHLLKVD